MNSPTFETVSFEFPGEFEDEMRRPAPGRPQPRPSTSRAPVRRPPNARRPGPRPRAASRGFAVAEPPCVCPAHGTEYVRWVQSALNRVEGAGLPVDGVMGAIARSALRRFQQRVGLPADGIAGPDTEQALRDALNPSGAPASEPAPAADQAEAFAFEALELESPPVQPMLRQGSRGSAVSDLQRRLVAAGFDPGAADGIFGSMTRNAVIAFQRARGLAADGIVGTMTWGALGSAAPAPAPAPSPAPSPSSPGTWGGGTGVSYGKGWAGSEGVADAAKAIAASMGITVTSQKRNLEDTLRVGSSKSSDHYTGNTTAFAVDFGVSGSRGDELARAIATKYGLPQSVIGTFDKPVIAVGDRRYRLQLLWRVDGHFDHVHLGIKRA